MPGISVPQIITPEHFCVVQIGHPPDLYPVLTRHVSLLRAQLFSIRLLVGRVLRNLASPAAQRAGGARDAKSFKPRVPAQRSVLAGTSREVGPWFSAHPDSMTTRQ